jgi:chromosome partitioning protein
MFGVLAEPTMTQLVDHQDAIAAGKGVTEYAPEGKASDEVRNLWAWIARKTKGK